MLSVKIITAYPEMFPGVLGHSVIGKALSEKKWNLEIINLHNFGFDDRGSIDDSPFGGGPGMILRADVVEKAIIFATKNLKSEYKLIYLSPSGKPLKQGYLKKLSKFSEIVILCGKFEGVDYRAIEVLGFDEISIGDYILSGGEVAAQVLLEGCIRMLPGVLGQPESILEESFSKNLLEHPQYTRPQVWVDVHKNRHNVPDILLSGHHEKIKDWRKASSFKKTKKIRPDLINKKGKNDNDE
tara:strand:+ start:593 stop:1315 length:723 start_codon:yes stop_codon:yes gene_type:complete